MTIHEPLNERNLQIDPEIRKFKDVSTMNDYLKAASRDHQHDVEIYQGRRRRPSGIGQILSWSTSDKLSLAILLIGLAAFVVTTLALLVAAGLLVILRHSRGMGIRHGGPVAVTRKGVRSGLAGHEFRPVPAKRMVADAAETGQAGCYQVKAGQLDEAGSSQTARR